MEGEPVSKDGKMDPSPIDGASRLSCCQTLSFGDSSDRLPLFHLASSEELAAGRCGSISWLLVVVGFHSQPQRLSLMHDRWPAAAEELGSGGRLCRH